MKNLLTEPRTVYPERFSFRLNGEIKSLTGKRKLGEFSTIKPALQQMLKELPLSRKAKATTRNKKSMNQEANIKVRNHPYTNLSKLEIMRRVQMQDVGNAFEIKIPATENNLVYIEVATANPHSNYKPKIYNT